MAQDMSSEYAGRSSDSANDPPKSESDRTYAKDAVNAAGVKIGDASQQVDDAWKRWAEYVAQEPGKSMLISAAAGALLTALVMAMWPVRRRTGLA